MNAHAADAAPAGRQPAPQFVPLPPVACEETRAWQYKEQTRLRPRITAGDGPKRDRDTVPAVDGHYCRRQRAEFGFAELLPDSLVDFVGDLIAGDERDCFGPFERGTFAVGVVRSLAPRTEAVESLLGFALRPRILTVHIEAVRTAVDLRGPHADQFQKIRLQAALADGLLESVKRVKGSFWQGVAIVDSWFHSFILRLAGCEIGRQADASRLSVHDAVVGIR